MLLKNGGICRYEPPLRQKSVPSRRDLRRRRNLPAEFYGGAALNQPPAAAKPSSALLLVPWHCVACQFAFFLIVRFGGVIVLWLQRRVERLKALVAHQKPPLSQGQAGKRDAAYAYSAHILHG